MKCIQSIEMKKTDIVVIGRGLFGGMINRYFRHRGISVLIIDSTEALAGSKCSAGIWNDGWVRKIRKEAQTTVRIMEELEIAIRQIDFWDLDENDEKKTTFYQVSPFQIIVEDDYIQDKVIGVENDKVFLLGGETIQARKAVIIAAGVWTDEILKTSGYRELGIDGVWGEAFYYAGQKIEKPKMWTWAPYRQAYAFNYKEGRSCDDCSFASVCNHNTEKGAMGGVYFANSSTVKNPKEEGDVRIEKNETRLFQHSKAAGLNPKHITSMMVGYRPFLRYSGPMVNKHDSKLYSATGGKKQSTILSGYVAHELYQMIYNE